MLCSRCGDPIRPIVAIDIDGTLGDYHKHFVRFALGYMGEDTTFVDAVLDSYTGAIPMGEWFCQTFAPADIRTYRDIKLAYRQGAQKRNMPIKPWAPQLTSDLRQRAEIWLTTTRPYLRLDGVDPDTRFWLHHHGIYYDHLLYHEEKYTVLANRVNAARVVAVVDDLHEELEDAERHFGGTVPILIRARHNRAHWNIYEPNRIAHNGRVIKALVDGRLDDWYERYGSHGVSEKAGREAEAPRT